MEYINSNRAQQIVDAIWDSRGVRKISEFRDAVLKLALFSGVNAEVSIFVKGWEAAGGGNLFRTRIKIGNSFATRKGSILWRSDPAETLEKMVAEMKPEILVASVMNK